MNHIEQTLTSMEVAEMVGKEHRKLLRDIRIYIEQLGESKIGHSDFFVESTWKNKQNKNQPCYRVSKKGCEFIAHKLTGVKGAAFTAAYINRFHEMEEQLMKTNHMDWFVNDVRVFQDREFGILRTIRIDDQDMFIGQDVTRALGYVNNTDTLKKRVSNSEKCYVGINDGNRTRRMVAITLNGMEQLIRTGKLPLMSKYAMWVRTQVLPVLRTGEVVPVKTGFEQIMKEPVPAYESTYEILEELRNDAEALETAMEVLDMCTSKEKQQKLMYIVQTFADRISENSYSLRNLK